MHGDDEGFDLEAYKKWRAQHPDSDEPELYDDEEDFEDDLEGGEAEMEDPLEEEKE